MKNEASEKPKSISAFEATEQIEQLLKLPESMAHERVLTWIRAGLYLITPTQVEEAVKNNVQVVYLLFNHLHLTHPLVKPLARKLFQIFWSSVSHYLTDAQKLYVILGHNPKIAETLTTPAGRTWVDSCCINGYVVLYNFVWL